MKIMGIDFGTKKIGIALSDEGQKLAFPKAVLANNQSVIASIQQICIENAVTEIVLGESKNYKGEENLVMKDILAFKKEIEKVIKLPVHLEPEFLTSREAEHIQGKNSLLDASAAAVILRSYLDKINNKQNDN